MARSRRIYITINEDKEEDRLIAKYLSRSYSESSALKELVYRAALLETEGYTMRPLAPNSNKEVQKGADSTKKVINNTNNTQEVQIGADDIKEMQEIQIKKKQPFKKKQKSEEDEMSEIFKNFKMSKNQLMGNK